MNLSISRRDFLKTSSAVGLAAAINPVSNVTASAKKSRVVIATDPAAAPGGKPDAAKIGELVDHAIMTFTGKTDKGKAYEALFPAPVTTSTKIFIKRNGASGTGVVNTAVAAALQLGLESMLNGSFPKANIENPTKVAGNVSLKSNTTAATYIINCPVAWEHVMPSNNYGVTLSMKNTMNYLGDPYTHHNDTTHAWLWNNSLDPAIKPKQVLSLMDAIVGSAKDGPGTKPSFNANTIIVSNDLVAVDYNTIRLMEKQTGAVVKNLQAGDADLKKAEAAGLGTCTPANMEVINISPPWPVIVGTINGSEKIMQSRNIRVINQGTKVDFVIPGTQSKRVNIFDIMGNMIWQSQNFLGESVSWDHTTKYGIRVPSGMYIFNIGCGGSFMKGTVMVRR